MRIAIAVAALCTVGYGKWYGKDIIPRLSDHHGFRLIAVEDHVSEAAAAAFAEVRPRRVYLVLIDGLRADFAARMGAMQKLAALGVCRRTYVSLPTVSRPVYAMVSTGLEQDRTGARNNDSKAPLAAESIWQVARASGRRVAAFSELEWWKELFPDGFDRYQVLERKDDFFAQAARADEDLVLVHPVYVDESGHEHGAASRAYADSAARVDRELSGLLAAIDLGSDTVVVTADHGHTAAGGHGGGAPEVATTLTCFAGRGVAHREVDDAGGTSMYERSVGPLVAVLAGLPFPRHMRPGLGDKLWNDLAGGLPAAYLADRRAAEDRFSQAAAVLPDLYRRERLGQYLRGGAAIFLCAFAFAFVAWRRRLSVRDILALIAWMSVLVAAHIAIYVAARGSLDMTSLNQRDEWIRVSLIIGLSVAVAGVPAHWLLFRDWARQAADQLTLVVLSVVATLVYAVTFGWVLGFPLPGAKMIYLPFFMTSLVICQGIVASMVALVVACLPVKERS